MATLTGAFILVEKARAPERPGHAERVLPTKGVRVQRRMTSRRKLNQTPQNRRHNRTHKRHTDGVANDDSEHHVLADTRAANMSRIELC
jgi:hypothetical protein